MPAKVGNLEENVWGRCGNVKTKCRLMWRVLGLSHPPVCVVLVSRAARWWVNRLFGGYPSIFLSGKSFRLEHFLNLLNSLMQRAQQQLHNNNRGSSNQPLCPGCPFPPPRVCVGAEFYPRKNPFECDKFPGIFTTRNSGANASWECKRQNVPGGRFPPLHHLPFG